MRVEVNIFLHPRVKNGIKQIFLLLLQDIPAVAESDGVSEQIPQQGSEPPSPALTQTFLSLS